MITTSAKRQIEVIFNQLLTEVKNNQDKYDKDPNYLSELVTNIVFPLVDVNRFSKIAMGRHWKLASESQQIAFTNALRTTLISSYSKSLILLVRVSKVEFLPNQMATTGKKKKYYKIPSKLTFESGETPLSIIYVVHHSDDKWLIFDLIIDGLSIARQLRSSYDKEISETGIEAVIARMNAQNTSTN